MPKEINDDTDQSTWVMLFPEECCADDGLATNFCTLKNPRTEQGTMYLMRASKVYEVVKFKEKYRSWFIEESVKSDGGLYLTTEQDPIYLMLPYLITASLTGKYMQLEQILEDDSFPEVRQLCSLQEVCQLDHLCHIKGTDDLKVYKYDQDKAMAWLTAKVMRLVNALKNEKLDSNYTRQHTPSHDEVLKYAHGMVCEYLPQSLAKDLQSHLDIKDVVVHEKPEIQEPEAKRSKLDTMPTEDYTKQNGAPDAAHKKNTRMTVAQKQLEKVDKAGMKSISSFFSPKSKK